MLGPVRWYSFNFMIQPEEFYLSHDLLACGQQTLGSDRRDGNLNGRVLRRTITPFFAGQRDFLEISAAALWAGHVHLVTPCSPTPVWEESSSAVVTFLSVVNPKPRPAGLVACRLAIPFLRFGEHMAKLAHIARV